MEQDQERALARATDETYRRIDEDLTRVPAEIRPALAEIRRCLFDADYDVSQLGDRFDEKRGDLARIFRAELEINPAGYLAAARLETAMRLLRDAELTIAAVSLLVGYVDVAAFRQAFRTWIGLGPDRFRRRARRIAAEVGWSREELLSFRLWERAASGEPAAIGRLRDWVTTLHPDAEQGIDEPPPKPTEVFWKRLAAELWVDLAELPLAEQRHVLRHELHIGHPALFHLLVDKSARHQNRQRAVELAKLALATLDGSAEALGQQLPALHSLGRKRLAEARRTAESEA